MKDRIEKTHLERAREIGMLQVDAEVEMFMEFLAVNPARNFMEIGSNKGGLFWLVSQQAAGLRISVDLPEPGPYSSGAMHPEAAAMATHLIRGSSFAPDTEEKVRAAVGLQQLDLLIIDGDHRFPDVDHAIYGGLVRPGGWVAFHDIVDSATHRAAGCAVGRYWHSLKGWKLELNGGQDWGGWGLLRV